MENLCCNKMSSFTNSSNSKLDSTKFETRLEYLTYTTYVTAISLFYNILYLI